MKDRFAVVGMGGVFPNAFNLKHYWETLLKGDSTAQKSASEHRWNYLPFFSQDKTAPDRTYSDLGGFIEKFEFDATSLNCTEQESQAMAPLEKWLLTALKECLKDISNSSSLKSQLILGGTGVSDPVNDLLLETELLEDFRKLGADTSRIQGPLKTVIGTSPSTRGFSEYMLHQSAALAIRKLLPTQTDYLIVDAACASSLYSIEFGMRSLKDRKIDIAYCGGVFATEPVGSVLFSKLNGLSKNGCFPFDERADGTLFGDGAGVIAIKRLEDAIRDGDSIYGVIRGIGMSSDGKGKAVYAPNAVGQVLAIRRAYEQAEVPLDTIQYVEAHATGTPLGDLTEYSALSSVFNEAGVPSGAIRLGSVKGNFGHLGWAAGTASMIKVLLSLKHNRLPPQANFQNLSTKLQAVPSPFRIHTQATEWVGDPTQPPRRAAISGFGFGGTNAHLIVEEFRSNDYLQAQSGQAEEVSHREEIVIASVGCVFPQARTLDQALEQARSAPEGTSHKFGTSYNLSPIKYKMIPRTAKVTDNSQFLLLDAAEQAVKNLNQYWDNYHTKTDVIIGYVGALNKYLTHGKRICWNAIQQGLSNAFGSEDQTQTLSVFETWETQIRDQIAPPSEDSFPGVMPSLLSGRISNYLNLQGTNLCVNSGLNSFIAALELGIQSLAHGRADVSLVGAAQVDGSYAHEILWKDWTGDSETLNEGALVFALMRRSDAEKRGIPILGQIEVTPQKNPRVNRDKSQPFGNLGYAAPAAELIQTLAKIDTDPRTTHFIPSFEKEGSNRGISVRSPRKENEALRFIPKLLSTPQVTGYSPTRFSASQTTDALLITNTAALAQEWLQRYPTWSALVPSTLIGRLSSETHSKQITFVNLDEHEQIQKVALELKTPRNIYFIFDFQAYGENYFHPEIERLWWLQYHLFHQQFDLLSSSQTKLTLVFLNSWTSKSSLHPYAGLFTGFSKALQAELPKTQLKLIFSGSLSANEIEGTVSRESSENDSVVYYRGSERSIQVLSSSKLPSSKQGAPGLALNSNSVVLAFGGGKGITRAAVEALLKAYRCKVVIVGSTQLVGSDDSAHSPTDRNFTLSEFIKFQKENHPKKPVKDIKKEYSRILATRSIRASLENDRRQGFEVSYLSCDVNDTQQVSHLVTQVDEKYGKADLVLYGAGVSGPLGKLNTFDYKESIGVTAVKVSAMIRVANAVARLKPQTFVTFSSIASQGIEGQASYGGASDFQNTLSEFMNFTGNPCRYLSINWPGWQDVGMLADNSALVEEIKKNKLFSLITPETGKELFLKELQLNSTNANVYLFGGASDLEYYAKRGKFDLSPEEISRTPSLPFYADQVLETGSDRILVERVLDLTRDSYLHSHKVNGDPVLPGMFELEMAAETAIHFFENKGKSFQVSELVDSAFHRFVKVFPGKNRTLRIEGKVIDPSGIIHIRIFSDFTAPNGKILEKNRLHFETTVHLCSQQELPASKDLNTLNQNDRSILDPYHEPKSPVYLDGIFVTVPHRNQIGHHSHGAYQPQLSQLKATSGLERFKLPSLLLDGALRLATAQTVQGNYIPLMVPIRIQSIRFFEPLNDIQILEKYGKLNVHYDHSENVCEISTPNGSPFCEAKGFTAHTLGYIDERDRSFVSELPALGYYLGKIVEKTDSSLISERDIQLEQDSYFRTAAKLNGVPVLPGSFQMEVATEAALFLKPDLIPQRIENMEFFSAFKMYSDRPNRIRIQAVLKESGQGPNQETIVEVSLLSDLIHKATQKVLQKNILHSTLRVVLAASRPAPKTPLSWSAAKASPERDIPGILYLKESPLQLGEYFTAVGDSQVSGRMIRSVYKNTASINRTIFGNHRIAPLLLDALLQNCLSRHGKFISTGIPKRIARIHLCELVNDWEIDQNFDELALLTQKEPHLAYGEILQAVTPDGRVLYQAEGFESYPLGYIDTRNQTWIAELPETQSPLISVESQLPHRMVRKLQPAPFSKRKTPHLHSAELTLTHGTQEQVVIFPLGSAEKPPMRELENLFHCVQELKRAPKASLSVICTDAWAGQTSTQTPPPLHPFSGAVEGLLKSVRAECPQITLKLLFTESTNASENLAILHQEIEEASPHWISYHFQGKRFLSVLAAASVEKERLSPGLHPSVVLVTGGGRGITAEICKGLAQEGRRTFDILGSSPLEATPSQSQISTLDKASWIQQMKKSRPESNLSEILSSYESHQAQLELQRNIAALRALGSEVIYHRCDISDSHQVASALREIQSHCGRIDHVIHGAGLDRSGSLDKKTFAEFRKIFQVKVAGFLNLMSHVDLSRLQSWTSFGSIHGVFGTSGQVDYCSANECLNTLTQFYQKRYPQVNWSVLNWPVWDEVGMAAKRNELMALLKQQGRFLLAPKDGVRLFLDEFHSGHSEQTQVVFLARSDSNSFRAALPLIDQIVEQSERKIIATKTFSAEQDVFLKQHLANGDPSLSAAFEMEMALELIGCRYPHLKVAQVQNCSLVRFVKVFPGQPKTVKVVLETLEEWGEEKKVEVRIFSDFIHSSGKVLVRDQLHWSAQFTLKPSLSEAGMEIRTNSSSPATRELPVPVYHPDAHVYYDPGLRSIRRRFLDEQGKSCSEIEITSTQDPFMSRFQQPHELIDALLLSLYFEKQGQLILAMPMITTEIQIFEALDLAMNQGISSFQVVAEPTVEIPNEDFDDFFGKTVLKCSSVKLYTPEGRLCVEAKDIYSMIYSAIELKTP